MQNDIEKQQILSKIHIRLTKMCHVSPKLGKDFEGKHCIFFEAVL